MPPDFDPDFDDVAKVKFPIYVRELARRLAGERVMKKKSARSRKARPIEKPSDEVCEIPETSADEGSLGISHPHGDFGEKEPIRPKGGSSRPKKSQAA